MNILIFGGTGSIGKFLVERLSMKEGYHIYVTSRKNRLSTANIDYICGNAHDIVFASDVLNRYHWDCIVDFMHYSTTDFEKRYELLLRSTEQFIFISSSRVYAQSDAKLTEKSPTLLESSKDRLFLKSDDYALAKARQEQLLNNSGFRNYTIVRPYMSYSNAKLDLGFYPKELWLKRLMEKKSILFPKDVLYRHTTLTYGYDVAAGIAALIGKKSALGETFHITQNCATTWEHIIEIYRNVLTQNGVKMNVKYIDTDKCYGYINCYDRQYDRIFDNKKIGKYLDVENFTQTDNGITKCVESFLSSPHFKSVDWRIYAHWDRTLNERTSISSLPSLKSKVIYFIFRYLISFPFLRKLKKIAYVFLLHF